MTKSLCQAISSLALAVRELSEHRKAEFEWFKSHLELATKRDLESTERHIMSAISVFVAKQNAFNERVDKAVTGVQADVTTLNDTIAKFQATPGAITTEDQALLDALEVRGEAIATKLEALDALTPPVA